MRLPDRIFTRALLQRAFYFWVAVRLLTVLAGGGGIGSSGPSPLAPLGTALVVLLVGFLGLLETRRRNEHLLLANFGVPQAIMVALSMLPPVLAEALILLVARR